MKYLYAMNEKLNKDVVDLNLAKYLTDAGPASLDNYGMDGSAHMENRHMTIYKHCSHCQQRTPHRVTVTAQRRETHTCTGCGAQQAYTTA